MIYILSITALLFSACVKEEPPIPALPQNYDCWEITVNDSLFNYLANLTEAPDSSAGYEIDESTYGPVDFIGACLFIPINVTAGDDMEYKLVWNGQIINGEATVYLHVVNHSYGQPYEPLLKHNRIYFNFREVFQQRGDSLKVRFHYYDQYYKEFDLTL